MQEGFFDHLLRSYESYAQKWEYVRENPVRAGLVLVLIQNTNLVEIYLQNIW